MAQAPGQIETPSGLKLDVVSRESAHRWLGCMLSAGGPRARELDIDHHLQAAAKAFYANRGALCEKRASITQRLKLFHAVVTSVACFAAEHRPIYADDLKALDVEFRRLVRQMVGPPPNTDWSAPWHEVLHGWNDRVHYFAERANIPTWSTQCIKQYWSFAGYVHGLPGSRWLKRTLNWQPAGERHSGMQAYTWTQKLEAYSRKVNTPLACWSAKFFEEHAEDFLAFCQCRFPA